MLNQDQPTASAQTEAGPGHVTFLPEPSRRERTMVVLLGVIAGLLGLLLVGLAAGAIWIASEYSRVQTALTESRNQLSQARIAAAALLNQTNQRQADMAGRLAQEQQALRAQFAELERQRQALGTAIPADPFAKADYAIRLSQLTLMQMALNNRYWTSIHQTVTRASTPLPATPDLADAVAGD